MQQGIIRIDCTALTHRHVVRRIETRRADVADCPRIVCRAVQRIRGPECIAVILDEPEIMRIAERFDRRQVKRIAERVRDHHRLCPRRKRALKHGHIRIVRRQGHIDKDGHGAVLDDRGNRRRESRRHRDHLVAAPDGTRSEER